MMWPRPGLALAVAAWAALTSSPVVGAEMRGPVPPLDAWTCPAAYPVKATVSRATKECFYHLPEGAHYRATKPDLCFASEDEARLQRLHARGGGALGLEPAERPPVLLEVPAGDATNTSRFMTSVFALDNRA